MGSNEAIKTGILLGMKISLLSLSALAIALPMMAEAENGVTFQIKKEDGARQYYRLEVPPNLPPAKPVNGAEWNQPQYATSKFSQSAVILAAVGWAGGLEDHDSGAPNTLTNLGGNKPGGFYHATFIRLEGVQFLTTPIRYYRVRMNGKIALIRQTFFADVLEDGRIVRPIAIPPPFSHALRQSQSRSQWGGSMKKRKWGGSEAKQKWGGAEKKQESTN
jgi:hypothetical protein